MWLKLYQSVSIWLVLALSRAPTHSSTVPHVQIGWRPMVSSIPAAAQTIATARAKVRRNMGTWLSRRGLLANYRRSAETSGMLRAYGPACDGRIIDATEAKIPDEATWVDLEEPTSEEEALVERC